ncbi:AlwI family type II restriction endonuclease [Helicobacter saguini]|uniref:AlwI family type II restriction endonuclease n=1 Tax=Helicobacter saguini TaxID=1548018 RepID=A0A347VPJ6_9HELI|nr:AlwI family type II restriction endonuclease [Helicobacter saguini]MWV61327.1 AlwI family type II restriction endonuclease [Helicobacter saguini]MWV68004.1 AlwI family type II restriction endonuclease [Helicobacter saguini]MWV70529.1 AlwI family type II restriction endonuclease [Helicobacter saguini]MWV72432.1 AlwI family type II restriction endonuclease [Helicobacter saguini]TLD94805.1 AlwI family type II restriction endonuclease [Helicobacter saguini]
MTFPHYSYFGNTSLRVKNLLYNFESQILLFDELFKNANANEIWANDSTLQIKYLEMLQTHNLLDSKNTTTNLGTKDARVKSAPLEDYNLIIRKEKLITPQGYELLNLIKTQSYKINNEFLQIDLISLFFLKASLNFTKSKDLLQKYLCVFKAFDGTLSKDEFMFLPLINNFKSVESFIDSIKRKNVIESLLQKSILESSNLKMFLSDLDSKNLKTQYFKTAKGEKSALSIIATLKDILLPFIESKNAAFLESLITTKDSKYLDFKKLYLPYITKSNKKEQKLKDLQDFCSGDLSEFGKRFFRLIFKARILANLKDYYDLNARYLNLTGIFEFFSDKVSINEIFKILIKHSHFEKILKIIESSKVSQTLLKEYFNDNEILESFKKYDIKTLQDLKNYKQKQDKIRLKNLLKERFSKGEIIKILKLFNDRKNDFLIAQKVSEQASVPTIFEYIIAICFHYIDDENVDRILQAGLSLDSNMLPKSHAIGGNADIIYQYESHCVMIEATLTDKTNQRRAEMESVSRHLGNLLLSLQSNFRAKTYAIFIAPHLDKNVLNDFRIRILCYFENDVECIKGMNILPLSVNDLALILESNIDFKTLQTRFYNAFKSETLHGSAWYQNDVREMVKTL